MDLAIGIDTGGTYTDGVLVDVSTGKIMNTTKTPTTHDDLSICVRRIFEELSVPGNEICLVSISTTLATNACAEGRGARCKLILFGSSPKDVDELGPDVGLIPSNQIYFAKGAVNMRGDVIEPFDEKGFTEDFLSFSDSYDAFGVVQMWGMKNPVLEKRREGDDGQDGDTRRWSCRENAGYMRKPPWRRGICAVLSLQAEIHIRRIRERRMG